ncbi:MULTISPECIES: cytochrome ubiquinol oxidase subunit I [Corynebacterium]|uniref:cytochrome ubiquinol oxidase subunit I n=1 Tax=Corynebacterium TaxID=1716 RepID=UPI000C0823A1|nr:MULTISPECIES: cytochrome ubiquinol oxidase subunit I [Corynebacterium]MBF0581908.1 cytochrome ubiquinol oxidase subunit I [Corynebacterium sp. ED61]
MDVVDISRWQFGITTVYHFIFVPLTIGLAPLVALMQTLWLATKKQHWYRATRFFGTIFLVNFAMGVATGIVQEFQFGMNWSEYSRMIGDVFGGPLALEGLIAFFLESTFLGLWIFGWGRIPAWLHTLCIWVVAVAVNVSAYFIIVANSFMQHPVGALYNPETGRAELNDFGALLTNPTALAAFPHTVAGSFLTAGTLVLGVGGWWLVREQRNHGPHSPQEATHRSAMRVGFWTTIVSAVALVLTGDSQAKLMFSQQPMKMASAESLCHTTSDPMFSVLTVGTHNNCDSVMHLIELPWVLPFLAEGKFSGVTLQGVQDLQAQAEALYGPGLYSPNLFVTYWAFRMMIGLMAGSLALAFFAWLFTRSGRVPKGKWAHIFSLGCLLAIPFPFLANSAGWVFTEMGRQPWIVHPNPESKGDPRTELIRMTVDMGVSNHSAATVWVTLIGFTLLYLGLAVLWFWLLRRIVIAGPPDDDAPTFDGSGGSQSPGPATPTATQFGAKIPEPVRFSRAGGGTSRADADADSPNTDEPHTDQSGTDQA